MRYPDFLEKSYPFPPFFRVQMQYPDNHIEDVEMAIAKEMTAILPGSGITAGDRVAVAVGSRGIDQLPGLVRSVCRQLASAGASPVIVPAMGSHGGATAEGQRAVLASLGVTEKECGAPILSTMDTVEIGRVFEGVPVHFSKDAFDMDHTICVNRIKPHTKFKAVLESGLYKMLCVGLGKHRGALVWHTHALSYGFFDLLQEMGNFILSRSNFRFGIGVVENAHDRPMAIEAIAASRMREREADLLEMAKTHFPRLPVKRSDVLVVRKIGKEISGAGMDPNVTGRSYDLQESDFSGAFHARRVAVLNLTKKTDGNAIGLGNADFITERVYRQLDYEKTVINALTSTSIRKAFIPVRLPTEEKAVQACFTTLGPIVPEAVGALIIQDTRRVSPFWASLAMLPDLEGVHNATVGKRCALAFDANGRMVLPECP